MPTSENDAQRRRELSLELAEFEAFCKMEARNGTEIVEAKDSVINHFVPQGLGPAGHFNYAGVKVCPIGKTEELEKYMSMTQEDKLVAQGIHNSITNDELYEIR